MKTYRALLCFIAPACVVALLFFLTVSRPSAPFIGRINYIRLLLGDEIFWKTFLRSMVLPALCLMTLLGIFLLVRFLSRKTPISGHIFFPTAFALITITAYMPTLFNAIRHYGYPTENYAAETIVAHIENLSPDILQPPLIDLPLLFAAMFIGIVASFMLWLIDKLAFRRPSSTP